MQPKTNKKLALYLYFPIIVVFLFLSIASFKEQITSSFVAVSGQKIENLANQSRQTVKDSMDEMVDKLLSLSVIISSHSNQNDMQSIYKKMHQQIYIGAFKFLAYGDKNGNMISYSEQEYALADPAMLARLASGEKMVSNIKKSIYGENDCIAIGMPIFVKGEPTNFIYTELNLENLLKGSNAAAKDMQFAIIQKNGNYIYNPKWVEGDNFFDAIENDKFATQMTNETLKMFIRNGASGKFEVVGQTQNYTIDYRPLDFNNWYIITAIETDILNANWDFINARSNILAVQVMALGFAMVLISALLYGFFLKKLNRKEKDVLAMINNINGGVFEYTLDAKAQFDYVSENFAQLVGYSVAEFRQKYDNCFFNMVYGDDRENIRKTILNAGTEKNTDITIEYRVETTDGNIIWLYDKVKIFLELNRKRCLSVSNDITDIKGMRDEIVANEECFKLIMERTNSIIIRWDIIEGSLQVSDVWEKKFGYPLPQTGINSEEVMKNYIFADDLKKYLKLCNAIADGKHYAEEIIRIRQDDQQHIWCRLCMTSLSHKNQKPSSAVAVVMDIDREKRQMAKMKVMAEIDGLSKLYNKTATSRIISDFLIGEGRQYEHALLMFDIDKFKRVNDTLGHIYGDAAIVEFAKILKKAFRSSDIIGRVGGDEFVVFIKNITSIDQVTEKSDEINRLARETFAGPNNEIKLSTSIGVSVFPEDGLNYEHLYRTADVALYRSKLDGRDRYTVYEFGMKKD